MKKITNQSVKHKSLPKVIKQAIKEARQNNVSLKNSSMNWDQEWNDRVGPWSEHAKAD